MIEITIEQAQKIYEENNVHDGKRIATTKPPEIHAAHLNALKAVIEAVENKWNMRMSDCCESAADHYERNARYD